MSKSVYVLVMSLFLLSSGLRAENWVIQTVDNEGDIGYATKCWYDSQGQPNLLYTSSNVYSVGILYHTRWTGAGWLRTEIATQVIYKFLQFVSIAPDTVAICYGTGSTSYPHIYYATWTGGDSWNVTEIPGTTQAFNLSLAFDVASNPHIFYPKDYWSDRLVHIYRNSSGSWQNVDTVTYSDMDYENYSVAIDGLNHIFLVYRTTTGNLKMSYYDGTAWGTEYVDESSDNVGTYCRIILDSADVPHIVYYDQTNTQLKYATWLMPPKTRYETE